MLAKLLSKIARNMLIKLAVAILAPIPVVGVVARAVAFVC
jgi:hypothetical protein